MIFTYDSLPKLKADETPIGRVYTTPDGSFPSITNILSKTGNKLWLQQWKARVGEAEAARITKQATDRGTIVHSYLERYWNNEQIISDLSLEVLSTRKMVESLIDVTKTHIEKVQVQEVALWSKQLQCAGRVDKVCIWDGVNSILDYKTSAKVKNLVSGIHDYRIQTCFYAEAHNEIIDMPPITQGIILIAVENKDPQIAKFDCRPYTSDLKMRINEFYRNISTSSYSLPR